MKEKKIKQGIEAFGRAAEIAIAPLAYYELVRDFNRLIQQELSDEIEKHAGDLGPVVTLVTTGSDGRREKGSFASPLEIIALLKEDVDPETFRHSLDALVKGLKATRISKVQEIKTPESSLIFFRDDPKRGQPGRIADSRLIYGSSDAVSETKVKLGREIISRPRKYTIDRIEALERNARAVVRSGQNNMYGVDALHFDPNTGKVYFDPKVFRLSFKVGPLRLVQNTLLSEEIKYTRNEKKPEFISRLHSGIVHRLDQLTDDRLVNLTPETMEEIAEHYAFFLRLYHRSEQTYFHNHATELQLDKSLNEEAVKRSADLNRIMSDFKIVNQHS